MEVLGDTADLPPADITVVAPGVWSPSPPATSHDIVNPYPSVVCRLGSAISVRLRCSAADSPPWMSRARSTTARQRVHLLSRTGTLPRVQVEATQTAYAPEHLTEDAVIGLAVRNELTAESVLALLERELGRFGFSLPDVLDDAAHADHWSDPLADPADLACHHTLSATNHALNCAFALLPQPERSALRASLGSKWFRYRVRIPLSRWRQLRAMQDAGRLILHAGVDANAKGLDRILTDLGVDRVIPAHGQSSTLVDGPELVADLVASGLVDYDDAGQGLVDPATCRA